MTKQNSQSLYSLWQKVALKTSAWLIFFWSGNLTPNNFFGTKFPILFQAHPILISSIREKMKNCIHNFGNPRNCFMGSWFYKYL